MKKEHRNKMNRSDYHCSSSDVYYVAIAAVFMLIPDLLSS